MAVRRKFVTKFLGIDVGFGTTDVLLITEGNYFKMVLPTRGQLLARQVKNYQGDIYIHGIEMGGNPLASALKEKLKEGFRVFISETAAPTIHYNHKKVEEMGFEILSNSEFEALENPPGLVLHTCDIEPQIFIDFFRKRGMDGPFDIVAVAVQDHGRSEGSSTNFRAEWIQNQLEKAPTLDSFLFSEKKIPKFLSRMKTITSYLKQFFKKSRIYVMDTVFAAIQGAPYGNQTKPYLISVDIGNGHTAAVSQHIINNADEILGYFEFHTAKITARKLEWAMEKLVQGNITNEVIWKEGGHGGIAQKSVERPFDLFVTGPHRQLIQQTKLSFQFGSPLGDMMITGCVGLAVGIERREKLKLLHII
ncbi:MAG: DUF1786 family protein [Candidatus Helarchaeota archaeon]